METLLVAESAVSRVLPGLIKAFQMKGVELRGCQRSIQFDSSAFVTASEDDWYTEYLAPVL
eukprot:UN04599